jgi:polyhydroxybutyrate depolymerase
MHDKTTFVFSTLMLSLVVAFLWHSQPGLARSRVPTDAELAELGFSTKTLQVGALERMFLVMPPSNKNQAAAVLIVLHGGTQSMRRIFAPDAGATLGWPALAKRANVLLLVPNAVDPETGNPGSDSQNWNDLRRNVSRKSPADDVAFITKMIAWAHKNYNTDIDRVYVTGASNGGMMTFRLLMELPDTFAAGAAMVAALPVDMAMAQVPARPTPLLIGNGTLDPLVKWEGGEIAGDRGEMQSVSATINWWRKANKTRVTGIKVQNLPDNDPQDGCRMIRRHYPASSGGADVVTLEMRGGGHAIPSAQFKLANRWLIRRFIGPVCRDAEGTQLIWRFLTGYKR